MIDGINSILKNDSAVQSEVGKNKADNKYKVYPVRCPDLEQHPYITTWITGKIPFGNCKSGRPTAWEYTFEVHSYAKNYDKARDMDEAVGVALDKQENVTSENYVFQEIIFRNTRDAFSLTDELYVRVSTFEAIVNEDQAT